VRWNAARAVKLQDGGVKDEGDWAGMAAIKIQMPGYPRDAPQQSPGTEESGREETTVWMDARNEFRMQWAMPQPSITGTGPQSL
jgi:hypothetical protein